MRTDPQSNQPSHAHRPGASRFSRFLLGRSIGIVMVLVGALLLTLVSGYYAYSASARSQLDDLNFEVEQPAQPPPVLAPQPQPLRTASPAQVAEVSVPAGVSLNIAAPVSAQAPTSVQVRTVEAVPPGASSPPQPVQPLEPVNQEASTLPLTSYTALYPAMHIHPKFWAQPLWSGGEPYVYMPGNPGTGLPDGFRVVSAMDDALRRGQGAATTRISIPLIDVDSGTAELAILNLGDSRAYETPKHLVGHIPQSPNPGEIGNAWYFGHLESPIKGEGNVFQRLPEIPDLLRDGDNVFVELESEDGRTFLYKTIRTEVLHEDELELYGADVAQLTLVACVPRLVYDHRILVTAELVGVKDATGAVN